MFKTTYNKGFSMTFANHLTISVQWGSGNYCDNKDYTKSLIDDRKNIHNQCTNAEIAIWDKDDNWFDFGDDTVNGYMTTNQVAMWIEMVSSADDIEHLQSIVKHNAFKGIF